MTRVNEFGQPIGSDISGWEPPGYPPRRTLNGLHVSLVPLAPSMHAPALFMTFSSANETLWTYMTFGPFSSADELAGVLDQLVGYSDWLVYAIVVGKDPQGFLAYLRIDPKGGVIEIGSIVFSPALQHTTAATEALFLLIDNAFALGYRRCEWKCDDLNAPSRTAAERLGFRYEGTFRKATHYKGRNRDTAWYAITDSEWPQLSAAYRAWLAPGNFDGQGRQLQSLQELRAALRALR